MIPALILTGFLGAGKTTVLNGLLAQAGDRRVAVIENEFGEVGIDADLLEGKPARVVELANGCVCCTVHGQLTAALDMLAARREELDLLLVETSGVADPFPVIAALQADGIRQHFGMRALVTVVDGLHAEATLRSDDTQAARQVRLADHLVITKHDRTTTEATDGLESRLRALNLTAAITRAQGGHILLDELLAMQRVRPATPAAEAEAEHERDHGHDHGHGFTSVAVSEPGSIDPARLELWLQALTMVAGQEILRIKGTLALEGTEHRYVVHGVRGLLDGTLEPSKRKPLRSRLVFIGRGLDEQALRDGFHACLTS